MLGVISTMTLQAISAYHLKETLGATLSNLHGAPRRTGGEQPPFQFLLVSSSLNPVAFTACRTLLMFPEN